VTVIDVDSHWEVTSFERGGHPLAPWLDRLPDRVEMLGHGVAGDLLNALPAERRPDARTLLPSLVKIAEQRGGPVVLHPVHDSTSAERVEWMDRVGIDHCLVNPGGYWQMLEFLGADRPLGVARCNDFLAERLHDHRDRLHGVAVIDATDLPGAAAELERARGLGYRAFFLYTMGGKPPSPVPFGHPDWDVVWHAAIRLGMVAVIHVGNTAADFGGWADIGWDLPGGAGIAGLVRLANTQRTHVAQNILTSMLYGGVFDRHPELTVLLAEMKVGWVPSFIDICTRQSRSNLALGDWPFTRSGGDMLRQNVRVTPLPGFGDEEALDVLAAFPEMVVFSSDYPHQEGNADPINLYGPALTALDPALQSRFLGETMSESYARMGDPLPAV
jgi:predicted TIM-barrel fold metal-dependent hydrolase